MNQRKILKLSPICFITGADNIENSVSILLRSNLKWIQCREKNRSKKEVFYNALKIRELTRKFNALFILNDHVDIALAVDADGVHLGQDDIPLSEAKKIMRGKIIGISTHNISEAQEAETGGADYIGFGPVFHTTTKNAGEPKGIDTLKQVKNSVNIPVIAIGGIKVDNIVSVLSSGCDGVAVSSGLLKGDIKENAKRFLSIVQLNMVVRL